MCANKKIHRKHMFKLITVNIESILKMTYFYRIIILIHLRDIKYGISMFCDSHFICIIQ